MTPALLTSTTGGAELGGDPVDGGLHLLGVADVGAHGQRPAAGGLDRLRRCPGRRPPSRSSDGDGEPVRGQPEGGGRADAAGGAGDDRDRGLTSADPLEHRGQALAAADAHRLQAVAGLAAVHLAQQRGEDPPAGRADRVAERDARAVDVDALEVARR